MPDIDWTKVIEALIYAAVLIAKDWFGRNKVPAGAALAMHDSVPVAVALKMADQPPAQPAPPTSSKP
jgi:hypothetical protein